MNRKQTIVMSLTVVWVSVLVFYAVANPDNISLQPKQQDSSFKMLSDYAKGYLDTTGKAIKTNMPKIP